MRTSTTVRPQLSLLVDNSQAKCMSQIKGQAAAVRAAEVAAAGGLVLTLVGPPNIGKSMIAERMQSIGGYAGQVMDLRPCECGYLGDHAAMCHCSLSQVTRHRKARLFGEALLKSRMICEVHSDAGDESYREPSADIRKRVSAAQERQRARGTLNAEAPLAQLEARLDEGGMYLFRAAQQRIFPGDMLRYDSVLRVAATIADMKGEDEIGAPAIAEAVQYNRMPRAA